MIYNGEFKDISDNLYQVKITTSQGGATQRSITLGGSPFTTEMDSSEEIIYKPVKYQSATVNIVTPDYNFDIYSSTAQGTKVELVKDSTIVWTGYVTPNLYDMGFEKDREEVEIECIDALSTLQYIKYNSQSKNVVSFLDIIRKILSSCNAYTNFYFSNNTQLTENGTASILDKLFISESNFFDEKEDNETDEDVAWTNQEVLEQICQYLGVTAVAEGNEVYFIDYDAIKNGINTYYKYSVSGTTAGTIVTKSFSKTIVAEDYSQNGATLSLDNVYNKVQVKDSLYDFKSVIPDMYDPLTNITKDTDPDLQSSTQIENGMYGEVVQTEVGNAGDKTTNNMIVLIDRVKNPEKSGYSDYNVVFVKYFKNPNYKFYQYNGTTRSEVTALNYTDTKTLHGAFVGKYGVKKLDKTYSYMEIVINNILQHRITLDDWLAKNEISSVGFQDYIVLLNPNDSNHIPNTNITDYPYLETTVTDSTALFGGKNSYLVISGSYNFHYYDNDPYPIPQDESDISEGRYSMDAGQTYLLAKLQWGNKYWNGTDWTSVASTFQIPYIKDDTSNGERRADNTMFKDLKFVNTVTWRIGTSETGYLIKVPEDKIISGLPILTLYKPFDPNYHSSKSGDNKGQHYKHCCVFLKNFQIKAIVGDPTFSDNNDTDTVYTNVINNSFVNELEDIEFKICTWDNKKPNYSSVAFQQNGEYQYLDNTYNIACQTGEANWSASSEEGFRQEEHLIYRLYNQYSTPSVILNLSLRNNNRIYGLYKDSTISNKDFIVDSINIDYKMNKQEIKLIEKK